MKKIVFFLLLPILLTACHKTEAPTVAATAPAQISGIRREKETVCQTLSPGETAKLSFANIAAESMGSADALRQGYASLCPGGEEETFFYLLLTVQNTTDTPLTLRTSSIPCQITFDESRTFPGQTHSFTGRTFLPGSTHRVYLFASVPKSVAANYTCVTVRFSLQENFSAANADAPDYEFTCTHEKNRP